MRNQKERFKVIASIYLLLIKNNKILLQKRANTGYEDGNYGLPAGHLENNESLKDGLIREISEEIAIKLDKKDVKLVHSMHRKEKDIRIDFFFTAKKYIGTPINNEPEKCEEIKWFYLEKLPKNTIPYIRKAIQLALDGQYFSEIGWNT